MLRDWMLPKRVMGNGEWGMGNGKWEMGNGNGRSKIAEIVVNAELFFFFQRLLSHFYGNVLRQNKGNLPMISSKWER